jgi:hypothetical protein
MSEAFPKIITKAAFYTPADSRWEKEVVQATTMEEELYPSPLNRRLGLRKKSCGL